ncbi:TPA_asm: hypothetical protein GNB58_000642 [Salmonella enterica subsp. houtenae serovar 45:g,z51:-]|uniref:Uncharacterized protein n=1 Tax=Salmonella enterica subsp. houtenae serovar 45:g,z51:- TaxID=1967611 RepID=A0A736VEM9_SALHO|nr:hypothetical protein [Salmonella enterica subsp. houtenae serovar 45:g,z51:-]
MDCSQYFLSAVFGMHGRQINTFMLSINLYLFIFSILLIKNDLFIQWNILILII